MGKKPASKAKSPTKAELVEALAERLDVTKSAAAECFDEVVGLIKASLAKAKVVSIPQFGTFSVQTLKARKGRNPRTNEEIRIPASKTVRFKPSVGLKRSFNS